MPALPVLREANLQAKARSPEHRRGKEVVEMDIIRRAWSQLPPTIWKKPSCAASAANSSRRAWREPVTYNQFNKSFAVRKKWAATILAPAAQERNSKSATARRREFPWGFLTKWQPGGLLIEFKKRLAHLH